ncbi:AMP-binding protein [bacterium]|nr:AMP-binding protein [bacterium]
MALPTYLRTADFCLHTALTRSTAADPAKTCLVAGRESYSYGQLQTLAFQFATAFMQAGIRPGDRVIIYLDNTQFCAAALFGTLIAGGVFVIVNPQTKQDKLEYIIRDAEAFALVTDTHLAGNFVLLLDGSNSLKGCYFSGRENLDAPSSIPALPLSQLPAPTTPPNGWPLVTGADLAALIYTSGSTGNPKGVMMTHQSMVFAAASLIEYLRLTPDDVIINVLPLAFDYGLYQLLMSVTLGATLVLERSFTYPGQIYALLDAHQVTTFPGVPTVYATLVTHHRKKPLCFPSVRRITNTAAALPEEHIPVLREIFPNAMVFKMYGLTECKRVCYLEPELAFSKPNSVGKAIPGTEVLVLDADGRPVPPNVPGILHVRGPHVMQGYWRQPELTRHMLKEGRFPGDKLLCSHDWFKTDADGYLYFLGRSDDIIKSRGEKVSPIEVENVLYSIPGVLTAAVVGTPDPLLDSAVVACVIKEPDSTLTEAEVRRICLSRLENFMVPSRIIFVDDMPKTSTGKVSKKELKAQLNL